MYVENTQPNTRAIGTLYLGPGINKVKEKLWETLKATGFEDGMKRLVDGGILKVSGAAEKITVALVEKTYEIPLLEEWLESARGPLKGAIKKQIKVMEMDSETKEKTTGAL